jgi:hypothetical protein
VREKRGFDKTGCVKTYHTIRVSGKEGELPREVPGVRHLVLLVSHGKEKRSGELAALLTRLGQTEAQDAVHAVEVWAVAVSDDAKGRSALVVAELIKSNSIRQQKDMLHQNGANNHTPTTMAPPLIESIVII